MADSSLREIQLSGKQLVFLFMASVVVAVAVFLLGVSVGRGVRENAGALAAAVPATETMPVPAEIPPPTQMAAADRSYASNLPSAQVTTATPAATSEPAKAPPAVAGADVPEVNESTPDTPAHQAAAPAPAVSAPAPVATPKTAPPKPVESVAKAAPAPASGFALQVDAFHSRENADKEVAQLKAKGFPAYVVAGPNGRLFRVHVGPYAQRADADRAAARLRKEGLKPSLTR